VFEPSVDGAGEATVLDPSADGCPDALALPPTDGWTLACGRVEEFWLLARCRKPTAAAAASPRATTTMITTSDQRRRALAAAESLGLSGIPLST
jgi:hypothetical protein